MRYFGIAADIGNDVRGKENNEAVVISTGYLPDVGKGLL